MDFKQEGDALFAEGEMEMKERCLAALLLVLLLSGCGGRVDRSAPEDSSRRSLWHRTEP